MWKTHAFRRALGPLLKQLDTAYDIPEEQVLLLVNFLDAAHTNSLDNLLYLLQQQDGPEPTNEDGSSFEFFPPAPVVLFCKNSPPLKQVVMQNQPISPKSASKSQATAKSAASRVPTRTRTAVRKVVAKKTSRRRSPSPETSHVR
jgi:hypothetical protein